MPNIKASLDMHCNFSHYKIEIVLSCSDSYTLELSLHALKTALNTSLMGSFDKKLSLKTWQPCFKYLNMHENESKGRQSSNVDHVDETFPRQNLQVIEVSNVGLVARRGLELKA